VKFVERKAVVNGLTACDLAAQVCIDICVCRFLIGNPGDVKLIAQSAINEEQHRNQTSKSKRTGTKTEKKNDDKNDNKT
jgi:hypothetical protein